MPPCRCFSPIDRDQVMAATRHGRPLRGRRARHPPGADTARRSWLGLQRAIKPIDILPDDHIAAIDEASLRLLEEIGIEFMGAAAREVLRRAGARVEEVTQL